MYKFNRICFRFQSIAVMQSNNRLRILVIILFSIIKLSHQTTYTCNPSASCGCSTNSATLTRIVGGQNAASATWGWAVSVSVAGTYLCGGSILSSSWVITAAHCVKGYTASQITIYAGSTARFSGTQSSSGSNLIVHPNYNSATYVNDLALLQLANPLSMSDPYVSTICLPTVSSATLSAGEWPAVNTSVSNSFFAMSVSYTIQ
jgi:secreted trypsin-like serine protease